MGSLALSMVSQSHNRYTRTNVKSLDLPHLKSTGAGLFNTLPVKCGIVNRYISENKKTFKHAVKKHIGTGLEKREEEAYIYY